MSKAEMAPIEPPKPKTIIATRGALYLLENILQNPEAVTGAAKVAAASRLWAKLRLVNAAKCGEIEFERRQIRGKDETDIEFQDRVLRYEDAFKAWQAEACEVPMTTKVQNLARKAIEWALNNRSKPGILPQNNDHLLSLLVAFGLDEDDSDES